MRTLQALGCVVFATLVFACSSTSSVDAGKGGSAEPAPAAPGAIFWSTFNDGRYAELGAVQSELDAEIQASPDDGYLYRLRGVGHLWKVAESSRDPKASPVDAYLEAKAAIAALERGRDLDPSDPWLPCFLGLLDYELGSVLGDAARVDAALKEFDRGIALYPQFSLYCRALARGIAPVGSPEFKAALEDYMGVVAICEPSVTLERPEAKATAGMKACTERARVPHGFNGIWMTGGDLFAKAGNIQVAKAFYANAKLESYEGWRFQSELEDKLAGVAGRAALYADEDPKNDPPLAFQSDHSCVMCHQR